MEMRWKGRGWGGVGWGFFPRFLSARGDSVGGWNGRDGSSRVSIGTEEVIDAVTSSIDRRVTGLGSGDGGGDPSRSQWGEDQDSGRWDVQES